MCKLTLPLAMLTAAGVFAADGTILLACDLDAAERAVRRIGVGSGSDCAEPVSGESGEGKLFRRAIAQAADSARDAREDRARHAALIVERTAAIRALDTVLTLPRPPRPAALDAVQARQGAAQDAIIRFDAGRAAALMNLVAADPARPVLDPDSLALRLKTLHEMAREAPAFGVALGLIALSALALDLLPLTVAIATRPGAYHLYRGAALEDASRKEAIRRDAADITDAATREKADEVRWHGDDAMRDIRKRQRRKVAEMSLDSLRGKAA